MIIGYYPNDAIEYEAVPVKRRKSRKSTIKLYSEIIYLNQVDKCIYGFTIKELDFIIKALLIKEIIKGNKEIKVIFHPIRLCIAMSPQTICLFNKKGELVIEKQFNHTCELVSGDWFALNYAFTIY